MNDNASLPERDLPPGRHRQLKEHLMREIRQTPESDGVRAGRRKWLLPAVGVPVAAGGLALALLVGGLPGGSDDPERGRETEAGRTAGSEGTDRTAVQLLTQVADRAAAEAPGDIRDDQYVYVSGVELYLGDESREREIWKAVDGAAEGLLRLSGDEEDIPLEPDPMPAPGSDGTSSCYRFLETLPTDPEAMLAWLYARQEEGDADHDADQDAFVLIGDLVREALVPPEVAAALYGAAALIPGVTLVPDAVDATGRPGVAVARTDAYNPDTSEELIFDEESLELLGTRTVALTDIDYEDLPPIGAGEVTYASAVLDRAVVDEAGTHP
ncbi:CU044_5270 family protein [Streptomyces sp. NBRC 109706]|uniref:CU044_5270 family protein n=1 Tax=Streptomyces sp. NBRC 109706 TaxID=1550035 RepID=UPI000785C650|nr:CU044_5270 family protein [Streptomyces sp. NBRC 109706]